ncbi:MAG: hypothetical protein ABSA91_07710 [Acidimicrobiales bacterium]|jgi:hypothetical protein
MDFLLSDMGTAGFLHSTKGGDYVDFTASPRVTPEGGGQDNEDQDPAGAAGNSDYDGTELPLKGAPPLAREDHSSAPKKVFVAHGKNRTPLEQLKKALDTFKVIYAIAVDEPNKGRPISKKVATLMRDECSSGIFIFTAD